VVVIFQLFGSHRGHPYEQNTCILSRPLHQPDLRGIEMSQMNISVSVEDAHLATIELVSQKLQAQGMKVEHVLQNIGVISGSIDSSLMNTLSQIEGVKQVEQERTYQLAPPDSDIQ
jgi:hypothetical protein